MIKIPVGKNKFALIDDEDFELVKGKKWYTNCLGYAICNGKMINYHFPNGKTHSMHRMILSAKKGQFVDHINHDGLDNRRFNIRICTRTENNWNKGKTKENATSKYKGISYDKRDKS